MPRRSILADFAGLVAVILALSGCATVPTAGPVVHHSQQAAGVNSGVQVDPLPPTAGASQLLVVEGFLHAMSTYQPDYRIARQYLTEVASANWHPESGVQVYTDGYPPAEYGQTVMLVAPLIGAIDSSGSYEVASGQLRHDFELVRDANAQWRISNPPEGLLVSRYLFSAGFTAATLHFLDTAGVSLVPDPRYFASGDQSMVAAVEALIAGPSTWIAPAVRPPASARIGVLGVKVDDNGFAEVSLGAGALTLNAAEREVLLSELVVTLAGFTQVTTVTVTAGGVPLTTAAGVSVLSAEDFAPLAPDNPSAPRILYSVTEDGVLRYPEGNWADGVPVETGLDKPERIAVRSDLSELAALTGGATRVEVAAVATGKARTLRIGADLLRPDFARNGELWSAGRAGPATFRVFGPETMVRVESGDLPRRELVASNLSPDGSRLALVLRNGTRTEVGLAVVVRSGNRIRLTGWRTLEVNLSSGTATTALDLGWASSTEIAVLQRTAAGDTSVIRVTQDGATATDIGPKKSDSLISLAVVAGRPALALTAAGTGYRFESEFNWTPAMTGVDDLAYSG